MPNIIRVIKDSNGWGMYNAWVRCEMCTEFSSENMKGRDYFGRHRCRWNDIKKNRMCRCKLYPRGSVQGPVQLFGMVMTLRIL